MNLFVAANAISPAADVGVVTQILVIGQSALPIAVAQTGKLTAGLEPMVTQSEGLAKYAATDIVFYAGDVFALTTEEIGTVDAIYDRGALVAFDYDQSQTNGPPFSVDAGMVNSLYAEHYQKTLLSEQPIDGRLATRCEGSEQAWLLSPTR